MRTNKVVLKIIMCMMVVMCMMSCDKVPAGNVGIKFYLLGGDKGVDYEVLTPGKYWIGFNEQLYLFPTQRQNKTWTNDVREDSPIEEGFTFQSVQGMILTANVGIEYRITPEDAPAIFEMYKTGLDEITNKVLRNSVRDAFNMSSSTRTAEEMYGKGKIAFIQDVFKRAKKIAERKHIKLIELYLTDKVGLPKTITNALNAKLKAKQIAQTKENELKQSIADAKKLVAKTNGIAQSMLIKASAEAKANKLISNSLTKELVAYNKILKWDGHLPKVTGGTSIVDLK